MEQDHDHGGLEPTNMRPVTYQQVSAMPLPPLDCAGHTAQDSNTESEHWRRSLTWETVRSQPLSPVGHPSAPNTDRVYLYQSMRPGTGVQELFSVPAVEGQLPIGFITIPRFRPTQSAQKQSSVERPDQMSSSPSSPDPLDVAKSSPSKKRALTPSLALQGTMYNAGHSVTKRTRLSTTPNDLLSHENIANKETGPGSPVIPQNREMPSAPGHLVAADYTPRTRERPSSSGNLVVADRPSGASGTLSSTENAFKSSHAQQVRRSPSWSSLNIAPRPSRIPRPVFYQPFQRHPPLSPPWEPPAYLIPWPARRLVLDDFQKACERSGFFFFRRNLPASQMPKKWRTPDHLEISGGLFKGFCLGNMHRLPFRVKGAMSDQKKARTGKERNLLRLQRRTALENDVDPVIYVRNSAVHRGGLDKNGKHTFDINVREMIQDCRGYAACLDDNKLLSKLSDIVKVLQDLEDDIERGLTAIWDGYRSKRAQIIGGPLYTEEQDRLLNDWVMDEQEKFLKRKGIQLENAVRYIFWQEERLYLDTLFSSR